MLNEIDPKPLTDKAQSAQDARLEKGVEATKKHEAADEARALKVERDAEAKAVKLAKDAAAAQKAAEPKRPATPVKAGFIRYRCILDTDALSNGSGTYKVENGYVDLPRDHQFYVLVGTYLFEE